jgi:hypothetical protein
METISPAANRAHYANARTVDDPVAFPRVVLADGNQLQVLLAVRVRGVGHVRGVRSGPLPFLLDLCQAPRAVQHGLDIRAMR